MPVPNEMAGADERSALLSHSSEDVKQKSTGKPQEQSRRSGAIASSSNSESGGMYVFLLFHTCSPYLGRYKYLLAHRDIHPQTLFYS
jgi:hypothetical protein